jgi:hypothetical protein
MREYLNTFGVLNTDFALAYVMAESPAVTLEENLDFLMVWCGYAL